MLIRSQDKRHLVNLNNVELVYVSKSVVCADFVDSRDDGFSKLGEYNTEEKALKVLDMIEDKHAEYVLAIAGASCSRNPAIFQMPEDGEV